MKLIIISTKNSTHNYYKFVINRPIISYNSTVRWGPLCTEHTIDLVESIKLKAGGEVLSFQKLLE